MVNEHKNIVNTISLERKRSGLLLQVIRGKIYHKTQEKIKIGKGIFV